MVPNVNTKFMINEDSIPYRDDVPLLKKLGLEIFKCKHCVKTFIGSVQTDQYKINVYVTCVPAQFFEFIIKNFDEEKEYKITTGSGNFTEYWNIAESFGRSLIRIDEIKINGILKYSNND